MINKIVLENFKNHEHTEIQIGRVTALVGPNGCGKTSVLQAVYALNQFAHQITDAGLWNWDAVHKFIRKGKDTGDFGICATFPSNSLGIEISGSNIWELPEKRHDINEVTKLFGKVVYFKAIAQNVAELSYTTNIPPQIGIDGSDLASVINYLKGSEEETHQKIEDDLKEIVPIVKRIRVRPTHKLIKEQRTISANGNTLSYEEDKQVNAWELSFDTKSGDKLPGNMVSEGTLIVLALFTLLHTTYANLFLLDDVEQGLHPLAQRQLINVLKDFAKKHDRQIILTSHSPYILDELDAENIWVMTTDKEGISRAKRLSDHPDAARALEVLTTGEFASAEGEDWVLDDKIPAETVNA